ncbi:MAG: crosslink repair DNA glycosylase YcaQ family protein [Deltaproteobacteria bacterium]|nr:crosslink repair DNA glycosylase YcaQ family protein [Deltaproteobacteria bacterium]
MAGVREPPPAHAPLPERESLHVEFKSDRKPLADNDLIEAVVCMANAEGGSIYLGVEDDGTPTGISDKHADPLRLSGLVASRTVPPVVVRVDLVSVGDVSVAQIQVPAASRIVGTTSGVYRQRRIMGDGKPGCAPMHPSDLDSRSSSLGILDVTKRLISEATLDDLDPVWRARLPQVIEENRGDASLLAIDQQQRDAALGLISRQPDGRWVPTLLGMLLVGRESSLQNFVPTHEVAFQVVEGSDVRTNLFSRAPLLRIVEWLGTVMEPVNPEQEFFRGPYRVGIPRFDRLAFREAVANALVHRDYSVLGTVFVRLRDDVLSISNPGGFISGVGIDNLLSTEPRARNPALADAFKRLGLVERNGRGVELIYRGQLLYARPLPSYAQSTPYTVVLRIPFAAADAVFMQMILEEETRRSRPLPIESLIALSTLRQHKRLSSPELATLIQHDASNAAAVLEALRELGFVQSQGRGKTSTYILSPSTYERLGGKSEYVRQAGFAIPQQRAMIQEYAASHGAITTAEAMELCGLSEDQARRRLKDLVAEGKLVEGGARGNRIYSRTQPE